ncbi:MAG: DUF819 family protein [Planctomycetota bacterium]|nr:DUF819 family protein [Planctomycetota bacterium]
MLLLARVRGLRGLFKYVPTMFWIYFVPTLAATAGLLPPEKNAAGADLTAVYNVIGTYCLPVSLVLLLLSVDIKAILKLGRVALAVMLAGSAGIIVGGPVVLLLAKPFVPEAIRETIWKGFGSLSASWIGGSANMIAVGRGLEAPANVYSPMVVVAICPYAWMSLLIVLSRYQGAFDRWNRCDESITRELRARSLLAATGAGEPLTFPRLAAMLGVALPAAGVALTLAAALPVIPGFVNFKAWSLMLATTIGMVLSFTPARHLERHGASRVGYVLLYFVLASIGATTTLAHLAAAPVLLAAGVVWILIHAVFILAAARIFRAPMSLLAAASQANVGGPASTPVLAEIYLPGLAPVGLLLAVLGNILGTYLGFVCASLCEMVNRW